MIDRLPAGATAIGWIDFEALSEVISAERWDEYEEMLQDEENQAELEAFQEATGIDVRTDIHQLGVAVMPGADGEDEPVVLVSVDFDRDRFDALLADAQTVEYEGTTMYLLEDFTQTLGAAVGRSEGVEEANVDLELESWEDAYIVVLDDSTVAVGTEGSLRVILDVEAGRLETLKSDPDMNALISDVAGHGQMWVVATKSTWDEQLAGLGDSGAGIMVPTSAIESINTLTLSMRMGDGISLRMSGIAATAEDARMLTESLNGLLAMGKMMLQGSEPQLFEILDRAVRAEQDGLVINIEATLTDADIEILRQLAEESGSGAIIGSGS